MAETAYLRDPRVVWHDTAQCFTVDIGTDPQPTVFRGAIDGDPDVWVCRTDAPWERIEGVPDSTNVDEVFYALLGEPENVDHDTLLVWAVRQEGCLTQANVAEVHNGPAAMAVLIERGMFEQYDREGGTQYWLTSTGQAKAAMVWSED